jgi:hypothetical protein
MHVGSTRVTTQIQISEYVGRGVYMMMVWFDPTTTEYVGLKGQVRRDAVPVTN